MPKKIYSIDEQERKVQEILDENDFPSLTLAYDEARRQIDKQFQQVDTLDVKASIYLALNGIIVTLILTALPTFQKTYDNGTTIGVGAIVIFAVLSSATSFFALRIRSYFDAPSIEKSISKYLRWKEEHTKYHILFEWRTIHQENAKTILKKINSLRISEYFLIESFIFSAITLIHLVI